METDGCKTGTASNSGRHHRGPFSFQSAREATVGDESHPLGGPAPATYEAASTRGFLHGRTETVRSCTGDALAFCRAAASRPVWGDARRGGGGEGAGVGTETSGHRAGGGIHKAYS